MTLRLRLIVILTCVLLVTVVIGTSYLMLNVRQVIGEELHSSVELSSKLIALALNHVPADKLSAATVGLRSDLARAGDVSNLRITVTTNADFSGVQSELPAPAGVPRWFVRLVHPDPLRLVRVVRLGPGPELIVLRADASDEIAESWREVRPSMLILVVFGVAANVLVYIVLGGALRSLAGLSHAFRAIEEGDYDSRVPTVGVPDIDVIADRFNHMSAVLARSNQETQILARRSLAIQEEERRRLAHELHDELGQSISAIKALAVSIRDRAQTADLKVTGSADTIIEVSSEMYDRVRRMMAHLRPVVLDELGLVSALQDMVDDWNAHHGDTFCRLAVDGEVPDLEDDVAISCYRIVQEALTNIAKHAAAEQVSVTLGYSAPDGERPGFLGLSIEDDGVGFNVEKTPRGLGLVGIHERVEAINGTIELDSETGRGTRYRIRIPLAIGGGKHV